MYITLDLDLPEHPKTVQLQELLGLNELEVLGLLAYFWMWCMRYAEDGDLSEFSAIQIAKAARWNGDAAVLHEGMKKSGWIDENNQLHAWDRWGGKTLKAKEKDARRQQKYRDKKRTLPLRHRDVTVTSLPDKEKDKEKEKEITTFALHDEDPAGLDAVIQIPLIKKGECFSVTRKMADEIRGLYPAVDVEQNLREIRAWNLANPKNRKTRQGIMRHIMGWMSRAQNKARPTGGASEEQWITVKEESV